MILTYDNGDVDRHRYRLVKSSGVSGSTFNESIDSKNPLII